MKSELQYAGEYNLLECRLTTSGGVEVDLAKGNQILEINFEEELYSNSVTGNIVIGDTHNLITELPIIGQELLSLKIQSPNFTEEKSSLNFTGGKQLYVYMIGVRAELSQGSQIYELRFTSQELIMNNRIKVSKSYTKTLSDIVEDVMTSEKLTTLEVMEKMMRLVEATNRAKMGPRITGKNLIPTRKALGKYLNKNYSSTKENRKHPITDQLQRVPVYFKEE